MQSRQNVPQGAAKYGPFGSTTVLQPLVLEGLLSTGFGQVDVIVLDLVRNAGFV